MFRSHLNIDNEKRPKYHWKRSEKGITKVYEIHYEVINRNEQTARRVFVRWHDIAEKNAVIISTTTAGKL